MKNRRIVKISKLKNKILIPNTNLIISQNNNFPKVYEILSKVGDVLFVRNNNPRKTGTKAN